MPIPEGQLRACPACGSEEYGRGECGCIQFDCGSVDASDCTPGRVLFFYAGDGCTGEDGNPDA